MTEKDVDVIIVGAGPVGLLLAYDISKKGHSIAIIDPKQGPTAQSRALLITSRTMEILDGKGFASDILKEAFLSSDMRLLRNGSVFGQFDACGDTTFPYLTVLMQGKTEEIIHNRLNKEMNCRVQWETQLESYTQDDISVTAIVKNIKTDEEFKIKASYIVADLTLEGDNMEGFLHRMNGFNVGNKTMGMVRVRPMVHNDDDTNVFRIFGNLESYTKSKVDQRRPTHGLANKAEEEPPDLQTVQDYVDSMSAPFKFKASNLIWSSYFRINERMVNGYRRGRAFVAGDAAHCHSPVGGQGMNIGLQDADNLAWKISAVLKGQAKNADELLDSYGTEREPHAKETIKRTSATTEANFKESYLMNLTRSFIFSVGFSVPQVREYAFKTLTQQNVCIDPSSSKILGTFDKGLIKTGSFIPDTISLRKRFIRSGETTIDRRSLRSWLVNNHQFILLFVNTCYSSNLPNEELLKSFWKNRNLRRLVLQSAWHAHTTAQPKYVTSSETEDTENVFFVEERIEDSISVTSRLGLLPLLSRYFSSTQEPSILVMIRPDFYVAHAKVIYNDRDLDSAFEYVDTVFNQNN